MPKTHTKKTPIIDQDILIYSVRPHTPVDRISYKIINKDIEVLLVGVNLEDRVEEIREKLLKCII